MQDNKGYPRRVKIGDSFYRIRFVKKIQGTDKKYSGMFYPHTKQICILNSLSKDETLKTYLHEISHAMECEYDIKISHKAIYQYEEAIFDYIVANMQKDKHE